MLEGVIKLGLNTCWLDMGGATILLGDMGFLLIQRKMGFSTYGCEASPDLLFSNVHSHKN
jgi:hypothetical protein